MFAEEPWRCDSRALLALEESPEGDEAVKSGFVYLLDVFEVRDVLEVWSEWRHGVSPSEEQKCEAVIHYATHDAYLPV